MNANQKAKGETKMDAKHYVGKGYKVETSGWVITLDDTNSPTLPVAIHKDTGTIYDLEFFAYWWEGDVDPDPALWSTSWDSSPLDAHWGQPRRLITDLRKLHRGGALRVRGAIHNLPGADSLGAVLC